MKRILLIMLMLFVNMIAWAQTEKKSGEFQVGAFGGISLPMGTYKSIGETKNGYFGGLFMDQYFKGNTFALGLDGRYLQHGIHTSDSLIFGNGHIGSQYFNAQQFKNWAITFGPTYKYENRKFHLELFVKGGVLFQSFPQHQTTLSYFGGNTNQMTDIVIKQTSNDSSNRAKSWVGLGGLRFNYSITPRIAAFAQVDYMQSFGDQFFGKAAQFQVEERLPSGMPIEETTRIKTFTDHYDESFTTRKTPYQSVNASVGVKFMLGKKEKVNQPSPVVQTPTVQQQSQPKSIQIVVKDKQTGLALSGVKVSIVSQDITAVSLSNADGQAEKVDKAYPMEYTVVGEKNGISTEPLVIKASDFLSNEQVLYREILHDDPRFTLIGETVECDSEQFLPNIATILTNTGNKMNVQQTSDNTGKFIFQLAQNSDYTLVANQSGKYSQTELVTTKGLDRSKTLYVTLKLGVCNLVQGGNWVLKNIHYDFDKSNIRTDAAIILDNVVSVMKQNPSLVIELSSHTDSRGNDQYNLALSQRRAESAVDYLVRNGIDRSRLVAKGYGETRLLNDCGNDANCSEEQHQENRRTEIKVLRY